VHRPLSGVVALDQLALKQKWRNVFAGRYAMNSLIRVSRIYDLPYVTEKGVHRYVDLRLHPDEINKIPELAQRPLLRELVSVLNSKEGPFMTHGTAFALAPPYEPGGTIPLSPESQNAAHWCTSYVTFSYWDMRRNKEEQYAALRESFTSEANGTEVCFVIQPAYFLTLFEQQFGAKWSETNATVCLLWVSGWGETEVVAHSRWRNAIKSLIEFFSGFKTNADDGFATTVSHHLLNENRMPPTY
jgi:hypothetical protein